MNSKQITEILKLFNPHKICINMPLSSRNLLHTPRNATIIQLSGMNYYNFGAEHQIQQNLHILSNNYTNKIINLTLSTDEILFFKSKIF